MCIPDSYSELVKLINSNFRIQLNQKDLYRNYLIGAGQYFKYLDDESLELTRSHFERALNSPKDIVEIKLRRGLRIKFYTK